MATTTVFSYTCNSTLNCAQRTGTVIELTTANIIPKTATIISATFTVNNLRYLQGQFPTMRIHYWPEGTEVTTSGSSTSYNNYNIPIISATWTPSNTSGSSGNYQHTVSGLSVLSNFWESLKGISSLPICISRYEKYVKKTESSSSYSFWVSKDYNTSISCTVTWEDNRKKPNYPTGVQLDKSSFTVTEATNGIDTNLRWNELSISSDASNKITGARIWYKEANASTWSRVDEGDITKNTISYPITVPRNKGTYYYVVQPLTDAGDSYTYTQADLFNNNAYARLTVSEIGNVTAPTSVWSSFGGLYLGESNKPSSFIINWSGAKGGTNNPIKSYQITCPDGDIYTINNPSATQYEINQSPNTGYYSITVWGEKDTTATAITTVRLFSPLSEPATPTITTQPSGEIIESSFTVGWSAATRPADVNSIAYIVYQYRSGSWDQLTETNNTQITLESSNFTGTNNRIGVVTRYYSSNGTYTDSSGMATTNVLKYATEIPLPDPFWASHYDTTTSTLTGKAENIYNNIKLTWYAIKDDNYSSSTEFSYQVYRSVNSGAYTALTGALLTKGNTGGTLTYTDNDIKNYRNSQIKYYILIINKSTNKTVKSPDTPNINVVKEIVITNFEVAPGSNEITSTNMPIRFNWTSGLPVLSEGSGISASLYMTYNNTTTLVESWPNLQENDRNAITPIDISLVGKQNFGDVFSQLYNRVITEGYPQPQVKLDLRLKYNAFSGSEISKEVSPVKLSYFTAPKITASGQLTVKLPNDRNYYNPGEEATVTLTGFSWADAAGNSTSPATEVKNYLYDKSTKQKYALSTSKNSTTVQLPTTSAIDTTLNLSLVTDIVYKGENITKQYELDRSCSIPIARWIAEAVTIRNVRRSERTNLEDWLEGQIIVPERYCGSDYYQNSSSITPNLSSPIGNEISCVFTIDNTLNVPTVQDSFTPSALIQDENQKPRIINFLFYSSSDLANNYSNIKLNFTLKFKNTSTSNNTLTIDNIFYRVLSADVDFAVRKGKIGVNVSKDFGTGADTSDSVLELNAAEMSEDAIVKITSAGSIENGKTKYISFLDSSGQKELSIYTENNEVFIEDLHIDIPEIDSTKLLSPDKNTTLTLNNNGVLSLSGTISGTVLTSKNYTQIIALPNVTSGSPGIVPQYGTSASGTINDTTGNRVLAVNNGTLNWYSLPANAFKDTTYTNATTTEDGLMSAADKIKLNGIAEQANKYELPVATSTRIGGVMPISNGGISLGSNGEIRVTRNFFYSTTQPDIVPQTGDLWFKPVVKEPVIKEKDYDFDILSYSIDDTFLREQDTFTVYVNNLTQESIVVGRITVNSFGEHSIMKITATCGVEQKWDFAMFTQPGQSFGSTYTYQALKTIGTNNNTSILKYNFNINPSNKDSSYTAEFTYTKAELENKYIEVAYIKDASGDYGNTPYNNPLSFTISFE